MKKTKQKETKIAKKNSQKQLKKTIAEELKLALNKFTNTSKKANKVIDKAVAQLVKKLIKEINIVDKPTNNEVKDAPNIVIEEEKATEPIIPETKQINKKISKK